MQLVKHHTIVMDIFQLFITVDGYYRSGKTLTLEKIVGGEEVDIALFPHQVFIQSKLGKCGGSIITPDHILTAAHCVDGFEYHPEQFVVRSGSSYKSQGGVLSRVKLVIRHENYFYQQKPFNLKNDIAILFLSKSLIYDSNTRQIPLISRPLRTGEEAYVSGWGQVDNDHHSSETLKALRVWIDDGSFCHRRWPRSEVSVCAVTNTVGGICSGDSGGSLIVQEFLAGITSATKLTCGDPEIPMLFTSIWHYRDWIQQNIGSQL